MMILEQQAVSASFLSDKCIPCKSHGLLHVLALATIMRVADGCHQTNYNWFNELFIVSQSETTEPKRLTTLIS